MSKIKQVIKDTSSQAEERISNPLAFAFIVAWLFWNYELMFYILSDSQVHDKIDEIQLRFSGTDFWLNGVIWPVSLSTLYLALWLPKILYGVANAHITNLHDVWVLAAKESTSPFSMNRELKLRRALMKKWLKFNNSNFLSLLELIREDPTKRLSLVHKDNGTLQIEYNDVIAWSSGNHHSVIKEMYYSFYESGLTETNEQVTELSKLGKSDMFLTILEELLVDKIV